MMTNESQLQEKPASRDTLVVLAVCIVVASIAGHTAQSLLIARDFPLSAQEIMVVTANTFGQFSTAFAMLAAVLLGRRIHQGRIHQQELQDPVADALSTETTVEALDSDGVDRSALFEQFPTLGSND